MVEQAWRQLGVFGPQNSARLPDNALAEFWLNPFLDHFRVAGRVFPSFN
jgi:hypothetical protein